MVFISRGPSKKSGELGNHETWYAVKFKSIKILILNKKETRNFAFPDISSLQRTSPSLIVIKRFLLSYCTICWYFYYVQCFLLKKKSPISNVYLIFAGIEFDNFWNLGLHFFFLLDFSENIKVLWGVLKKSWLERYLQLSFMHVCKYLNHRLRKIGE